MDDFDKLYKVALHRAPGNGYIDRLKFEYTQIRNQGAEQYWINLFKSRKRYKTNKNGLILPFLLRITDVDPIASGINPNIKRDPDMPDIDLDFIPEARDIIKQWAINEYGYDKVCSVGLWQTYNPKSALEDVARALGYDHKKKELIVLAKSLPADFDDTTYEKAYGEYAEFRNWVDEEPINKEIAEQAFRLVGKIKTQGKHAGGLIISKVPLINHLPMTKLKDQWTSEWTEGRSVQLSKFGFVKYDILGLKTLSYIWNATRMIKKNHGVDIHWEEIGYGDEKALQLANKLKTDSIFQFDTDIAKGILSDGGAKSLDDLMVYTSLGRPGPMPMIKHYIERRDDAGQGWKREEHPKVTALLEDTYGITVFQEQVTSLLTNLAGFTIPEADKARKIMSKKWADQMIWVREKTLRGFSNTLTGHCPHKQPSMEKMNEEQINDMRLVDEICGTTEWTWAKEYWKRLETFARYSFNRSHATSYSIQSYRCLYLKAHYPPEWWSAVLNGCDLDRIPQYISVARSEGVKFGSLEVNNLSPNFTSVEGRIVPGLLGVKNIGEKMLKNLNTDKKDYRGIDDFVEHNGKNKTLVERLIKLGAFDQVYPSKKMLWYWYLYAYGTTKDARQLRTAMKNKHYPSDEEIQRERDRMAKEYLEKHPKRKKVPKNILTWKPIRKKWNFDEFVKYSGISGDYTYSEILEFQQEFLGYYWDSPIEMYQRTNKLNIESIKKRLSGKLECVVLNIDYRQTSNGNQFATLTVTDGMSQARVNVWSDDLDIYPAEEYFMTGVGLRIDVKWSISYKSFSVSKYGKIVKLAKKSDVQSLKQAEVEEEYNVTSI